MAGYHTAEISVTQILREINFKECRSSKTAIFGILGALDELEWQDLIF